MLTALVLVAVILVVGTRLNDALRLRQEEVILKKLPLPEAHAYYEVLKRRARKVKLLRAVTLGSLVVVVFVLRRFLSRDQPQSKPTKP
jgi:hypothetical protein